MSDRLRKLPLLFFMALFLIGCVQMRDYVGTSHGYVTLGVKQGFGEGGEKKSYHVTEDGTAIIKGDSKDEIISKLGYADKKEVTIEGYECWIYEKTRLKLFFKGDHLREWVKF